jgi:hypothetical protein
MSPPSRHSHTPSPSRTSLLGRMRAGQLAPTDTKAALEAARNCPDAWYRVQALASVAHHAEPRLALPILEEAAREALACHDAYGTVAVMSWPLKIALARGFRGFAERERARCLDLAPAVEPHNSRAYALKMLWTACHEVDPGFARPIWALIRTLCHPDRCWRAAQLWRHVAEALEAQHPGAGGSIIRAMPEGKARRRLERRYWPALRDRT